jgi:flavin reductase (DIM6/NTAB) family NADH-FMN oxidoreductase RutF
LLLLFQKKKGKIMAKIKWRGGALTAPVPPAMVTVGEGDEANIVTVAWTGIVNTVPPKTYISVRPTRHSYGLLKKTGEFCVNLTPAHLVKAADFCGMYTGKKVDKFKKCGLTRGEASEVGCPIIEECPLTLECKVLYRMEQTLDTIPQEIIDRYYPNGDFHYAYYAEIVGAYIAE